MAEYKSRFSQYGLGNGRRVDIAALSPRARRRLIHLRPGPRTTPFTASATVKHNFGAIGMPGIVRAAYLSIGVLPNIATSATARLVAYDKSGNAEVNLTDTFDVEDTTTTLVAREAAAMALATTNVALDADDTFEVHLVAGGAITANATDLCVTIVFEPTEETNIEDNT
jgi:hypothetical protein